MSYLGAEVAFGYGFGIEITVPRRSVCSEWGRNVILEETEVPFFGAEVAFGYGFGIAFTVTKRSVISDWGRNVFFGET